MSARISQAKCVQNIYIFSSTQKIPYNNILNSTKQCHFKFIPKISLECCNYLSNNCLNEVKTECSQEQQNFNESLNPQSLMTDNSQTSNLEIDDQKETVSILMKYHQTESNNIFKNIIQSFMKLVDKQTDKEMQKHYLDLAEYNGAYNSLKKIIKNKLKQKKFRWNYKIISLIKSKKYQKLFKYFLINIDYLWLDNSKVERKADHKNYVKFLIRTIEDPYLMNKIIYYRKK